MSTSGLRTSICSSRHVPRTLALTARGLSRMNRNGRPKNRQTHREREEEEEEEEEDDEEC